MRYMLILTLALCVALASASANTESQNPNVKPTLTDNLLENIKKRRYDDFVNELATEGMDANQPDSHGRLPLMEAVRTRDIKFVDALIQFGAIANSRDPATGTAPLQVAFQNSLTEIGRLLLKYGADVNVEDKGGKRPRDYAPEFEIAELIKTFDVNGSMAFEDAPGSWTTSKNENGDTYWFNTHTKESRWDTPPSCAWQRVEVKGQHPSYVNYVTGQKTHRLPKALSWRLVSKDGQDVWFNWAVNASQFEEPAELNPTLLAEAKKQKNLRWYNPQTKEFSWEDPRYLTPWRAVVSEKEEHEGQLFYYNVNTGESTWEVPEDLAWRELMSKEDGKTFWHNAKTGESTWDTPELQVWERHETDL